MAHEKSKKNKKSRKLPKPQRPDSASEGRATMNPDLYHPDTAADPQDGVATIHPVTSEMLDHAAHRAAELADDVAHHAAETATDVPHDVAEAATDAAAEAQRFAEPLREVMGEVAGHAADVAAEAVAATEAVVTDVSDAAVAAGRDGFSRAEEMAARAAGDAQARLTGAADTLGRYNAALIEMARANMAATGELFAALLQAKSVPEAVAINADHLRRQFDAMSAKGRELASLAQELTFDSLKPLR